MSGKAVAMEAVWMTLRLPVAASTAATPSSAIRAARSSRATSIGLFTMRARRKSW